MPIPNLPVLDVVYIWLLDNISVPEIIVPSDLIIPLTCNNSDGFVIPIPTLPSGLKLRIFLICNVDALL